MTADTLSIFLPDPEAGVALGHWLAERLGPGDCLLLIGPIGAGKTHLARSLIQHRLAAVGRVEDIPSPTFTLVQVYDTPQTEIWHADLYRLSHPQEVVELGLDEAFAHALCLVEWPDRLGDLTPQGAIHIQLRHEGEGRIARITGSAARMAALGPPPDGIEALERDRLSRLFVDHAGWGDAARGFLAGDASARRYDRLQRPGQSAVLMDAPPEKGEDVRPFVTMARHLRGLGLSAPEVLAEDAADGFLLLEDLGDSLFARVLEVDPAPEDPLYRAATEVLAHLQAAPPPPGLPAHTPEFMAGAAGLAIRWYARAVTGEALDPAPLEQAMAQAMAAHCTAEPVLVLRDYHAENLLWLPGRTSLARVGLLDFQMGSMGQPEYDLISLLQDARRDVPPALAEQMVAHFAEVSGRDPERVATACAVLGAQRNLRILGGFTRLSLHFGKPGYVQLIPRVWDHVQRNLAHPALAGLRAACAALPLPTPAALQRITELCGTHPDP